MPRGSKARGSKPGERRGGRKPGTPNKAKPADKKTLEELAREYTPRALGTLAEIAFSKTATDAARVSAASALLDRGYGKPKQATEVSGANGGPIQSEDLSNANPVDIARRLAWIFAAAQKAKSA
jgi:hypothetical protein